MGRILVVEDSRTQAEELRFVLESAGFQVEIATSAEEALTLFDPARFQLVMSDIVMPGMTGYDLCRQLKAQKGGAKVPVVLLSSLSDPMDIVSGLECGADNFLTKPYDPDLLIKRVRTVLDNRTVRRSGQDDGSVDVMFLGQRFLIRSDKEQILDLLLSTFEDIVHTNRKLQASQAELSAAKHRLERQTQELERLVQIRTRTLEDQKHQLAEAQAIARLGNWRLPRNSKTVEWSDEMYRIFRLDTCESPVLLDAVLAMLHPSDQRRIERSLQRCSDSCTSIREEFRVVLPDGKIRYCWAEIRAEKDTNGAVSALFGICQDMTTLKLAEITARENAERYLGLVDALPDSVLVEAGGEIVFANGPAAKLLGVRSPAALIGKRISQLQPMQQQLLRMLRSTPSLVPARPRMERLERPDGTTMEAEIIASVVEYNAMEATQLIVRDVTERNELARHMQQTQRMDAIGQLTGGIAHDFNNLLAVIMGNAELLRELLADDTEEAELADEVLGAAGRGADLVRRLLAFARKQVLEPKAINLNDRLSDILALLRRTLGGNVRIQTNTAPQLWTALVDPAQVDDAILNLAINARDAMPSGGTITIETANVHLGESDAAGPAGLSPGDYVMLAVCDTGVGMPPEVAARALEPFFTTKEPGRGTGLGLSQVYGLVGQSGGHLKIDTAPGQGTAVRIYLPRVTVCDVESDETQSGTARLPTGSETILVVDDNPDVRTVVIRQLSELGYQTIEAENANRALELLDTGTAVDLLFTDIVMPGGMTGFDLADAVQTRHPGLRMLFTSGYTDTASQEDQRAINHGQMLSKPYRKQDLARAIRSALEGRRP